MDKKQTQERFLKDICKGIERDLQNLLNTSRRFFRWPSTLTQLENSLMDYGLPDYTSTFFGAESEQRISCKKTFTHMTNVRCIRF